MKTGLYFRIYGHINTSKHSELPQNYYVCLVNVRSHSEMVTSSPPSLNPILLKRPSTHSVNMRLCLINSSSVKADYSDQITFLPFKTNILPPSVITLLYLIQYKKSSYSYLNPNPPRLLQAMFLKLFMVKEQ